MKNRCNRLRAAVKSNFQATGDLALAQIDFEILRCDPRGIVDRIPPAKGCRGAIEIVSAAHAAR
jgi:hypothetical protein